VAGTVPVDEAFLGFGHPATVTVALVLIIGRALINSGAVALIARHLLPPIKSTGGHIADLSGVAGSLSMIMNNVGALVGWRLIPKARRTAMSSRDMFHVEDYVTEARAPEDSRASGETLTQLKEWAGEHDADILAVVRDNRRIDRPGQETTVRGADVVVIRTDSETLDDVIMNQIHLRTTRRHASPVIAAGGTSSVGRSCVTID
jgi:hypothetical protein